MAGKKPHADGAAEWQKKLEFLLAEEARLSDPAQKFGIQKLIEEAADKVRGHTVAPPSPLPPRDAESERQARKLEELYDRKMDLALAGEDVSAVTEEINDVRRLLHRGPLLRPGDFLADGRFKLGQVAGQGGFATVWQAADRVYDRVVALKVLHAHHGQDLSRRDRFLRGAREMADLRHQHVVAVLDAQHQDHGWHFFVMEYVAGSDFEEAILAGRLTREEQLTVLRQTGEALAFAHGRGVVHRDVKPSNILLSENGRAKLTDFDLVRADDSTGFTATHAMLGTLQFAAPEALHSAAGADVRADIYSLASTAVFALLEGRLPATYYRDPAQVIAGLAFDDELRQVLTRATSFERQERFSTVEELCESLADVWPGVVRGKRRNDSLPADEETHHKGEEPSQVHRPGEVEVVASDRRRAFWKRRPALSGSVFGLLIVFGIFLFIIKMIDFSTNAPETISVRRRALLVGINDYSAFRLGAPKSKEDGGDVAEGSRNSWPNLEGAVNDVEAMAEMLVGRFGFQDIRLLKDQEATRDAILQSIEEHLVKPSQEGDLIVFHYSGRGSEVRNTKSRERDKLDESIVPADSRLGARDVRDKELRGLFNQVLAKKARLVVIFDRCISVSGVRGLPDGSPVRGIRPDLRDVADAKDYGPPIEQAGALILSATRDDEEAIEGRDEEGRSHGVFTLALLRALRAAPSQEPARYVFKRALALMSVTARFQRPVLEGLPERIAEPLFGGSVDGYDGTIIAVDQVRENGEVELLGGWVDGLAVGSDLRSLTAEANTEWRLRVVALHGLRRSTAEIVTTEGLGVQVERGDLFEIATWVTPRDTLKVWTPQVSSMDVPMRLAAELAAMPGQGHDFIWVEDPTEMIPTHVLRWSGNDYRLLGVEASEPLGSQPSAADVVERLPKKARLFFHLPAPAFLLREMEIGPGTRHSAIEPVDDLRLATYVLTGRLRDNAVEYAWIRPGSIASDQDYLPARSAWIPFQENIAWRLRDKILRLFKVRDWILLEPPAPARDAFPYRLAIADSDGTLVDDGRLYEGQTYTLVLKTEDEAEVDARGIQDHFVYIFTIDSSGSSAILYPQSFLKSENRYPGVSVDDTKAPGRIDLGADSHFDVTGPFGVDTFFLFSSSEPIDDPSLVFEYEGVRGREPSRRTALASLLAETGATRRSGQLIATAPTWSIDKVRVLSLPAPKP